METLIAVERSDDAKFNNGAVEKSSCPASQSTEEIDHPVVYQLVRVQSDGTLVPATEDEVMEVKNYFLEVDKMEIDTVKEDSSQTIGGISSDGPFSEELLTQGSKETAEVYPDKLKTQLEYIEEMLQKVNREERLFIRSGSYYHSSAYMNIVSQCSDQHDKLSSIDEKLQTKLPLHEIVSSLLSSPSDSYVNQTGIAAKSSNFPDELHASASSTSALCTILEPPSNGEIYLGNLSIRQLHEVFKATFGRDTNAKDKHWLMRRIVMGLTNTCDVSTTVIIRNNKLTNEFNEEISNSVDGCCTEEESSISTDGTTNSARVGVIDDSFIDLPIGHNNQMEDHQIEANERLRNTCSDYGNVSDDSQSEQRAAIRVRKPTKRYIEELSEVESRELGGKFQASISGYDQVIPNSQMRHVINDSSDGRELLTGMDSLGGFGAQTPYISRVRRGRPKKNVMSLMKLSPSSTSNAAKLVKKAHGVCNSKPDNEIGSKVFKCRPTQKCPQPLVAEQGKDFEECPVTDIVELEPNVDPKHVNSSEDASDDNVANVFTTEGGIRRKHKRVWTISEVIKLLEGVSRYGVGRWCDIKRLGFSSDSYRTSVDLKDKWRNLMKASFAQTPRKAREEHYMQMISRKLTPARPIPAPILLRVRELAEMQS